MDMTKNQPCVPIYAAMVLHMNPNPHSWNHGNSTLSSS